MSVPISPVRFRWLVMIGCLLGVWSLPAAGQSDEPEAVTIPLISRDVSPPMPLTITDDAQAIVRVPPGEGPFPAVVFLHGGLGHSNLRNLESGALTQPTQSRFLAWGYVTVNATRRSIADDPQNEGVIEDTAAIVEAVRARDDVDPDSIVLYGGSGGGTLALETARVVPLAAVAAGEPASIIFMGMFTKDHVIKDAAGKVTRDRRNDVMGADPHDLYTDQLRNHTRAKLAQIECPVLILHGDRHALYKFNSQILVPEMKDLGKAVELKLYPGENHGFYWGRSSKPEMPLKANRDADAFFRQHVKVQPRPVDAKHIRQQPVTETRRGNS